MSAPTDARSARYARHCTALSARRLGRHSAAVYTATTAIDQSNFAEFRAASAIDQSDFEVFRAAAVIDKSRHCAPIECRPAGRNEQSIRATGRKSD